MRARCRWQNQQRGGASGGEGGRGKRRMTRGNSHLLARTPPQARQGRRGWGGSYANCVVTRVCMKKDSQSHLRARPVNQEAGNAAPLALAFFHPLLGLACLARPPGRHLSKYVKCVICHPRSLKSFIPVIRLSCSSCRRRRRRRRRSIWIIHRSGMRGRRQFCRGRNEPAPPLPRASVRPTNDHVDVDRPFHSIPAVCLSVVRSSLFCRTRRARHRPTDRDRPRPTGGSVRSLSRKRSFLPVAAAAASAGDVTITAAAAAAAAATNIQPEPPPQRRGRRTDGRTA